MRRPCTCKWAGKFSFILLLFFVFTAKAEETNIDYLSVQPSWSEYTKVYYKNKNNDRINGISYVISGSIALVGGIVGQSITSDPLEQGIYALFETIGIASVGYGAYKWKIGDDDRLLMATLRDSKELTNSQKVEILRNYYFEKKESEKRERTIKAITHGLIAALNFYNGSQQSAGSVRNTIYFVAGANLLACISYTF